MSRSADQDLHYMSKKNYTIVKQSVTDIMINVKSNSQKPLNASSIDSYANYAPSIHNEFLKIAYMAPLMTTHSTPLVTSPIRFGRILMLISIITG